MVTLVAAAGFGALQAMRLGNYRAKTRAMVHRRLSWLMLLALGVHIGAALLDQRHVPAYAVVAPFLSPVRRFAAGTGSLALLSLVLVVVTAAGRRWFRHSWRRIHHIAYAAAGFAVLHSMFGSDPAVLAASVGLCLDVVIVASMGPRRRATRLTRHVARPTPSVVAAPDRLAA